MRCGFLRGQGWVRGFAALTVAGATVASGTSGPVARAADGPDGPIRLNALSPAARLDYLRRAQVWMGTRTASLDLLAGPPHPGALPFLAEVACHYVDEPGGRSGKSPKFYCRRDKDQLKVRYRGSNGEVYAAVAASRLLWALGFGVDPQYPVRITCLQCPIEPWYWKTTQRVEEKVFDPAIVERRFQGVTIESRDDEGWTWAELDLVDPAKGGAPREQREALKLLAVLLQHGDNRASQQRFVCLPEGVQRGPEGETCTRPFLAFHDLGATFGGAGRLTRNAVAKLSYAEWSKKPIFKDPARCVGQLHGARHGELEDPTISEAGRQFLAERLDLLSPRQIHDLFTAAQIGKRGEMLEEAGKKRPVTVEDWVRAFVRKRAEIADARCPS
jgi:hypothetical protein